MGGSSQSTGTTVVEPVEIGSDLDDSPDVDWSEVAVKRSPLSKSNGSLAKEEIVREPFYGKEE